MQRTTSAPSAPDVNKYSQEFQNDDLLVGVCSMKGWRPKMEDAHCVHLNLGGGIALLGVFDGHGGESAAIACAQRFARWIIDNDHFRGGRYSQALKDAYANAERRLRANKDDSKPLGPKDALPVQMYPDSDCKRAGGTTAVTVLITQRYIYSANVGDSRCVLSRDTKCKMMTLDHRPDNASEADRVKRLGGVIVKGRVGGMLCMTRSLGDFILKDEDKDPDKQPVSAIPHITMIERSKNDQILVLGCDGIFDCLKNEQVTQFFLEELCYHNDVALACENLCDGLLAPTLKDLGTDNMTVMCAVFKKNLPVLPIQDEDLKARLQYMRMSASGLNSVVASGLNSEAQTPLTAHMGMGMPSFSSAATPPSTPRHPTMRWSSTSPESSQIMPTPAEMSRLGTDTPLRWASHQHPTSFASSPSAARSQPEPDDAAQ